MQQEIYKNPDQNVFNAASGILCKKNSEKKKIKHFICGLWKRKGCGCG